MIGFLLKSYGDDNWNKYSSLTLNKMYNSAGAISRLFTELIYIKTENAA